MAFCFAMTTSVATTTWKFTEYLPIKRTRKYKKSYTVWKVIPPKIDKVSNSIDAIIKRYKPIC